MTKSLREVAQQALEALDSDNPDIQLADWKEARSQYPATSWR